MSSTSLFKASLILPLIALSACGSNVPSQNLDRELDNPLTAERYYDDLVEQMVNLVLQNDPLTEDPAMADIIEDTRVDSLSRADKANDEQERGLRGFVVSDFEYAIGEVLLLDGVLYTDPGFETKPGPDLHVYLSTIIDPRDGSFPDESAIDLGLVKNPFGAHTYILPEAAQSAQLRTFVLYDTKLKRIYGFAQLSGL